MSCKKKQKHMSEERAMYGKESTVNFTKGELKRLRPSATAARIDLFARAAIRVVSAFQSTLTQDMIFHSFQRAAQTFPLSLERKLSLYHGEIPTVELKSMQDSFATCVDLMRATGRLTEAQMDDLGDVLQ